MVSPNAKFADMRATSILVPQTLYGISSAEEESTTNAWHAVDIGDAYQAGESNTITFNDKNTQIFRESNLNNGCEDSNTYNILIEGLEIDPSASVSISVAGSTATMGEDFDLSTQELSFNGSESKVIEITNYDDAVIEGSETIVLSFVYNGEFQKQEYAISDDDFVPRTGTEPFDLLATEEFSESGSPQGWTLVLISDGVNQWSFNGDLSAAGRAYITDGVLDIPFYDQNSPSITMLRSPLLNAAAATNVNVSFEWEAGGETDALDPEVTFDYGEFVCFLDGANFIPVQKFVKAGVLGTETSSGIFDAVINELDGQAFFLGWRWFNDTNAGSQFSFAFDKVTVTAIPAGIETEANEQSIATVNVGNTIFFLSETDNALIGKIENASQDLGCVTLSVIEAGTGSIAFSGIKTERPSKAFSISITNEETTYDLTLYFTDEELAAFDVPAELIPLKVNSSIIDDANEREGNFTLGGVLTEEGAEDGFRAYTGSFSGSGTLSVVQDFEFCSAAPSPWKTVDVGNVTMPGEVCYLNESFEVTTAGNGIARKSDEFHFTYQELSGDVEIIAQVTGLENTGAGAKAAVMIRETLTADSKFAMTTISTGLTGATTGFQYRKASGANVSGGNQSSSIPQYIRIVRSGKDVISYVSTTNGNWQLIGTAKINTSDAVFVGLAATSGKSEVATTAIFEDVTINGFSQESKSAEFSLESEDPEETESASQFEMYPNPATTVLHVAVEDHTIKQIAIYDLSGKLMKSENYKDMNHTGQIQVPGLYQGMYILKLHTNDGLIFNGRFLKE